MSQHPASDKYSDEENEPAGAHRLDQSLRDKFSDFRLAPSPEVWAGLAQRLPPDVAPQRRPRRWPVPLPWLMPLFLLLGVGGGWLLRGAGSPTQAVGQASQGQGRTWENPAASAPAAEPLQAAKQPKKNPESATPELRAAGFFTPRIGKLALAAASSTKRKRPEADAGALRGQSDDTLRGREQVVPDPLVLTAAAPGKSAAAGAAAAAAASPAGFSGPNDSVPAVLLSLVALERQASVATERAALGGPPSREAIVAALRAERAELGRLQHRADSLLLALGETPATSSATASADTLPARRPLTQRWSVLLSAAPEQSYFGLKAPAKDTLSALRRNHETGRIGLSATLLGEYRLTERVSIGAGLGYNRSGAQLRLTNRRTDIGVTYDTTTVRTLSFFTRTNTVFAIRIEQIPQLSPRFNGSGQVIGYDTVYVSRQDTTFTTIVQSDTVHTENTTINPRITKKETVTYKQLRPDYHFLTLPVLLRYRLASTPGRWWADVALGAQLQFFLGGTQLVTEDGRSYRTETVGPRGGPFRPLNIGLSGALSVNYALNSRLSLSLAPALRWQMLSVYKPETGLSQNPVAAGLQFGVRWKL